MIMPTGHRGKRQLARNVKLREHRRNRAPKTTPATRCTASQSRLEDLCRGGLAGHPLEQPIAPPLKKARHPALILFGQAVRERRRALGHSQEGFAYAASMDRGYVGGLERGAHNATLLTVLKVIGALGMTPSQFFAAFDDGPTNANAAGPLLVKTSASAPNDRGRNHP